MTIRKIQTLRYSDLQMLRFAGFYDFQNFRFSKMFTSDVQIFKSCEGFSKSMTASEMFKCFERLLGLEI